MLIELKDIKKVYGKGDNAFVALRDIDLKIEKGEFVAIMGPSGSGKSTLMNILGALSKPSSGRYLLKGKEIQNLSERQLAKFRNEEVGFIFQSFNLLRKTTVLDNVIMPSFYSGKNMREVEKRARKILKEIGIGDKLKNKSNELSGGQMQRVAIARALIMNPSIIMADEPTGNLDSKTTKEILEILINLHKQGNTILLITHEQYIAEYADRIISILDGVVQSDKKNRKRRR